MQDIYLMTYFPDFWLPQKLFFALVSSRGCIFVTKCNNRLQYKTTIKSLRPPTCLVRCNNTAFLLGSIFLTPKL